MERTVRFITTGPPAPAIGGDRIRLFNLIRQLSERGWNVRTWSLVAKDEPEGFAEALQAISSDIVVFPHDVTRAQRLVRFSRNTASRRSYHRDWFASPTGKRAAARWFADIGDEPIVVQQLFMLPFVPRRLLPHVLLDTQNLEVGRLRSIAYGDGQWLRRVAALAQLGPVLREEQWAARSVALCLAVSEEERAAFETMAPGHVRLVPNGVDAGAIRPLAAPTNSSQLLFLGSLGYAPNVDAVRHFSGDISPQLTDTAANLTVVGSNPSQAVRGLLTRSRIPTALLGFVPDLEPVFRDSRMMVVPLRHGAGTRLKILEALAWGLPVVTTTIGAEGIGVVDGEHVLFADDPAAFATAVHRLLEDDELWLRLSRAGRQFVVAHFDWNRIGIAMDAATREVAGQLRRNRSPAVS